MEWSRSGSERAYLAFLFLRDVQGKQQVEGKAFSAFPLAFSSLDS